MFAVAVTVAIGDAVGVVTRICIVAAIAPRHSRGMALGASSRPPGIVDVDLFLLTIAAS